MTCLCLWLVVARGMVCKVKLHLSKSLEALAVGESEK